MFTEDLTGLNPMKTTLNPEINEKLGLTSFHASLQRFKNCYEFILKTFMRTYYLLQKSLKKVGTFRSKI